jgi:hypothetical protein
MRPFDQGKKDFYKGKLSNPYDKGSRNNRDWEYGFNKAYFENLKRVQEYERKNKLRA